MIHDCLEQARALLVLADRYCDAAHLADLLGEPHVSVTLTPAEAALVAGAREGRHEG